jgi:lysozyme
MARKINAKGRALIAQWEGRKIKAYLDGGGVPTICVGHTGDDVELGMIVTPEECDRFFEMDIEEHNIEPYLKAPATDDEYAAMASLCFNIGLTRFRGSTVLKRHNLGNRVGAANAFRMWIYDNGKVVQGLKNRREAERKLYLGLA